MENNNIPYDKLKQFGIEPENISAKDYFKLLHNQATEVIPFALEYTKEREELLKQEKIAYSVETQNNKQYLRFSGRIQMEPTYTAENTPQNIDLLKRANVQYETSPENEKVLKMKDSLALMAAILNPEIGAILAIYYAMKIIPKRLEVKNEMGLSRDEMKELQSGKMIQHRNGDNVVLMQLDKDTNSITSVKQNSINIPDTLLGQELSQVEKARLLTGNKVTLDNGVILEIDLLKKGGLKYTNSQGKELSYKEALEHKNTRETREESTKNERKSSLKL